MIEILIDEDETAPGFSYIAKVKCPDTGCSENISIRKLAVMAKSGTTKKAQWVCGNFERHVFRKHVAVSSKRTQSTDNRQPSIINFVTKPSTISQENRNGESSKTNSESVIEAEDVIENISDEDETSDRVKQTLADTGDLRKKRKTLAIYDSDDDKSDNDFNLRINDSTLSVDSNPGEQQTGP